MVVEIKNNFEYQLFQIAAQLKENQLKETLNYAKFLLYNNENEQFSKAVSLLNLQSESFAFLNNEPDLYTEADITT